MTSQEIQSVMDTIESGADSGAEVHESTFPLWEIAFQLAKMREQGLPTADHAPKTAVPAEANDDVDLMNPIYSSELHHPFEPIKGNRFCGKCGGGKKHKVHKPWSQNFTDGPLPDESLAAADHAIKTEVRAEANAEAHEIYGLWKERNWECPNPGCRFTNFAIRLKCRNCNAPKPPREACPEPFTGASSQLKNLPDESLAAADNATNGEIRAEAFKLFHRLWSKAKLFPAATDYDECEWDELERLVLPTSSATADHTIGTGDRAEANKSDPYERENATLANVREIATRHGWNGQRFLSAWLDDKLAAADHAIRTEVRAEANLYQELFEAAQNYMENRTMYTGTSLKHDRLKSAIAAIARPPQDDPLAAADHAINSEVRAKANPKCSVCDGQGGFHERGCQGLQEQISEQTKQKPYSQSSTDPATVESVKKGI